MSQHYLRTLFSDSVVREQERYYGKRLRLLDGVERDTIGPEESDFIASRDSFYLASVSPEGWPYLQHRGGPRGFLTVRDPSTLAFADFSGNRQLITTGNVAANDKVALFLMDYPEQARLKLLGHATVIPAKTDPELARSLTPTGIAPGKVERVYVIRITGLNWNCSQYITPRFTTEEIEKAVAPLRERIRELEAELKVAKSAI